MGSKISIIEDESSVVTSKEDMKRPANHKTQGSLLPCCTDSFSSVGVTTPEYQIHRVKRSRKSLGLPEKEDQNTFQIDLPGCSSRTLSNCSTKKEKESFLASFFRLFG